MNKQLSARECAEHLERADKANWWWCHQAAEHLRRLDAENTAKENEIWKRINQINELDGAGEQMSERIGVLEQEITELRDRLESAERQEPVAWAFAFDDGVS